MKLITRDNLEAAAKVLNRGGILGVPTETVYGLAVKADNTQAIVDLLHLKDREIGSGKVLTMMVSDVDEMQKYANMTFEQVCTARHYFPGELTMILPKRRSYIHPYFDHFDTIGIRIPAYDYMLNLLKKTGPLLVTSANRRGDAPCKTGSELSRRLPEINSVVKGVSGGDLPSTVIDMSGAQPRVVRQGGLLVVHY